MVFGDKLFPDYNENDDKKGEPSFLSDFWYRLKLWFTPS